MQRELGHPRAPIFSWGHVHPQAGTVLTSTVMVPWRGPMVCSVSLSSSFLYSHSTPMAMKVLELGSKWFSSFKMNLPVSRFLTAENGKKEHAVTPACCYYGGGAVTGFFSAPPAATGGCLSLPIVSQLALGATPCFGLLYQDQANLSVGPTA